jgi:pimeloyl-ACP methyl ester carboxylesterase
MTITMPFLLAHCMVGALLIVPCSSVKFSRRKPNQYKRSFPETTPKYTIEDMDCHFIEQPLNHFLPNSPTYLERYCIYDKFSVDSSSPILFYTGNESPLEQYINQTGLMWELAPILGASVVFAEHRYEGQSLPNVTTHCMSYSSSKQALADYAVLLDQVNPHSTRPVIAFGGSYGGMLSAWMRRMYPNIIAGAIAASAPIWGFPRHEPRAIDAAYGVVSRGLAYGYPATVGAKENSCFVNLLAAWPLITHMGETAEGRDNLQEIFSLCQPLRSSDDARLLLDWAQSPWFDMAEGSFPYPSSYIPFALHMGLYNLPAWPLQAACWQSELHRDHGVVLEGDLKAVRYKIRYANDLALHVDWDNVTRISDLHESDAKLRDEVRNLLTSVRDAVSVWFNVSKQETCFNVTPAINSEPRSIPEKDSVSTQRQLRLREIEQGTCHDKMINEGTWNSLCCNEDMNLVITCARGLGRDVFWPPSHPRGTQSYADVISDDMYEYCADPSGSFGYPTKHDPWSKWLDIFYGGLHIETQSNIVFSNGLLDPWSAAGVHATEAGVHYVTDSIVAVVIEYGGHHTDLMYSHPNDPAGVRAARLVELQQIEKWIHDWKSNNNFGEL